MLPGRLVCLLVEMISSQVMYDSVLYWTVVHYSGYAICLGFCLPHIIYKHIPPVCTDVYVLLCVACMY